MAFRHPPACSGLSPGPHIFAKRKKEECDEKKKLHSLRHTSATLLLYGGVNIRQVQARLGHSEIETTQKYLHYLTDADAEAATILTNMIDEQEDHNIDISMAQ